MAWVSWSIGQHERLWVAEVPRSRWRGVREKIRRADRDADYLAVEVSPGALHVVSTVCFPGASPVTTQLAVAQAVYALQHARHVIRPVMASPAWKTPDQRSKSARDRAVENAVRGIGWEVVAVVPKFRWTDLLDRLAAAGGSWRCERSEGGAELMRWIPPEGTGQREAEAFFDRVVSEALGPPVPEW